MTKKLPTADEIKVVLSEIQSRIPKLLLKNVLKEVPISPTMLMVIEKALADPKFPKEKKKELQDLKDSGVLTKKRYREDKRIAKQIGEFVEREIQKAIKVGRLPPRKYIKDLPHVKDIINRNL